MFSRMAHLLSIGDITTFTTSWSEKKTDLTKHIISLISNQLLLILHGLAMSHQDELDL